MFNYYIYIYHIVNNMIDKYNIIVEQFNNLKDINTYTENIYSNISYLTTNLAFQYNEVIEEKDSIIMDDIFLKYFNYLKLYDDIAKNIVKITKEYEELVINRNLILLTDLEKGIIDVVTIYNENIEKYNILTIGLNELYIIYIQVLNRTQPNLYNDGPIILPEKYNYLENKIKNIVITYNNALDLYNSLLINNVNLMKIKTEEIEDNILYMDTIIDKESTIYKIRLFSILLNIFIKHFRFMTYNEKNENLVLIQIEYLKYLKDIDDINKSFIISHLHPIYISPLLLLPDTSETIILKDNIVSFRDLSTYYGSIAPDFIQFNVKVITPNIRNSLYIGFEDIGLFNKTYDGKLFFYPDYRGMIYEIEVEAYSMLISQMRYKFILVENGFPPIKPINFIESNIRLGNINNNTFNLNLRDYYSDSNSLYMVHSTNNISETLSNLTLDDVYIYNSYFIENCNIPVITDNIVITPYLKDYPVFNEEYSNTSVNLSITSSPMVTFDSFSFNFSNVIPYIYDLTLINEWYINVTNYSIVTYSFVTNTRKNLKNPDLPIILKDPISNILYIYPDYRGDTYIINVIIETMDDYALKNIIELTITESTVPKPTRTIRNLLLEHLLIKENLVFNANNYFSTITGSSSLKYNYNVSNIYDYVNDVSLNILPYNAFVITSSNLIFNPDYRNISYDLYIYAIDPIYNVISDDNLILTVREDKILNKIDELYNQIGLGNDIMEIDIYEHLRLPDGQELRYRNGLRYSILVDKELRKSRKTMGEAVYISDGILYIDPDFRNDIYNVTVFIEAYEFVKVDNTSFNFMVSEVIAEYPKITNKNILIQNIVNNTTYDNITKTIYVNSLTIFKTFINLDLFFENEINYSKTRYSLSDINNDFYTIENNTLIITPNVRDISYSFSILGTDNTYNVYNSESNLLNISIFELPPIILNIENTVKYELTDEIIFINLDDIFISIVGSDILKYYVFIDDGGDDVAFDIRLNVSTFTNAYGFDNNILKLLPDYRGISYKLNVTAINFNYITQPVTYYIDITEANRLPPIPKIDLNIFELNLAYFTESTLSINLENLFTHFKYYPNYVIRLSSKILQLSDFINIRLGHLVIDRFTLTFNFSINVFLFDIIENKKVDNDEITISFTNNIQTLRFIGLNRKIIISLEQISDKYRYDIINGLSNVTITNNNMTITKNDEILEYDFTVNKVHILLNLIVKQIFYKVL